MNKSKNFFSILIPSATVFFSSGCIMVLELVAGRLIARHLGSSLYTWTSVIGVVLLGITIGNYLGGCIADRFAVRKALAVLFAISSLTCVVVVILNNLVSEWIWLWKLSWPACVFSHVFLVFFLPSTLLGTISPVVAKMALDKGLPTGRTVGDIYAWGAAGSIVGTFLTGFYLIAAMGTVAIIWIVGAFLLLMAILYWARLWILYLWAAIFIALMTMAMAPADWAKETGTALALREKSNPDVIYKDESQYCYIAVKRLSETSDERAFMQDKLMHSKIVMGNVLDLQYSYEQIHAAVTHLLSRGKKKLSVLVIGGGGYVFPRYIEKSWPGSRVDVAEIDPSVTEAAMQAFGLERDTTINTFTMDARNYVNQLLEKERNEGQKTQYDFIYEDALDDYSIPYQLTTREFNDKIAKLLTDTGVYMIELIDIYDSGLFVGAFINTLEQTFPYVYVVTENKLRSARNTFVILAAKHQINLENLGEEKPVKNLDLLILSDSEIETLKEKAQQTVLTDNFAPVENLLAPVVLNSAAEFLAKKYFEQAKKFEDEQKWDESIAMYKELISINPPSSITAYSEIGAILAKQGKWEQAINAFKRALEYNEKAGFKQGMANINHNIGLAFLEKGKMDEAVKYFNETLRLNPNYSLAYYNMGNISNKLGKLNEASANYKKALELNPDLAEAHHNLGLVLRSQGRLDEAISHYRQALQLKGDYTQAHNNLGFALWLQGRLDEAISHYRQALQFKDDYVEAHNNLGIALRLQGKYDEAAKHLRRVIQLVPSSASGHYNLGAIYYEQGKADLAITHWTEVLKLKPDFSAALNGLGWILSTTKDANLYNPTDAVKYARKACELSGYSHPDFLDTLAAAYAAAGRFQQAIETAKKAKELAEAGGKKELAEKIQGRLQLYEAGIAFRGTRP